MSQEDLLHLSARVRLLERTVKALMEKLEVTVDLSDDSPGSEYPDVLEAVQRGNKIEAIKLYSRYTGAGLAEAKRVIDEMM